MSSNNVPNNEEGKLNQIESNYKPLNLISNYILKKIFDNIQKNKVLEIIKYNKDIQKRINININDYKEYLDIYSPIEIEIIPAKNKYGEFISISEGEEIYFHIYFNDNKKQVFTNILRKEFNVKKIKIIIGYQIKSFKDLFFKCECIESIYFKKFYRNNINNMSRMFYECSSLKELNLSNFNTNNAKNMNSMFCDCCLLKELNLSKFNTKNVTDMGFMFSGCSLLEVLNLMNFNTENVTNMDYMFSKCPYQLKLKIKNQYKNFPEMAFDNDNNC
jgi:surface protein